MIRQALTWLLNPVLDWLTDPKTKAARKNAKRTVSSDRKYGKMTDEKRALADQLLKKKVSVKIVAKRLNVHRNTIHKHVRDSIDPVHKSPKIVSNNTVTEIGGHPDAWAFVRGFRRIKSASVTSFMVYATLKDDMYMSPREVWSAMKKSNDDLPSVQSCLSGLARMGVIHRKLMDDKLTKGYLYRRITKAEPLELKKLWEMAS